MRNLTTIVIFVGIFAIAVCIGLMQVFDNRVFKRPAILAGVTIPASQAFRDNPLTTLMLAEIAYQNQADTQAAQYYLKTAAKTKDPNAAKRAAELALRNGQFYLATQAALIWLNNDPNNLGVKAFAAELLLLTGAKTRAKPLIEGLLGEGDDTVKFQAVNNLLRQASPDNLIFLNKIITKKQQQNPDNALLLYYLATINERQGDFTLALQQINKAIKLMPNWLDAIALKVDILTQDKQTKRAIKLAKQYVNEYPNNNVVNYLYANTLMETHHYAKAKAPFKQLLSTPDFERLAQLNLGKIAIKETDMKLAKHYLEQIPATSYESQAANFYLAKIATYEGDTKQALTYYLKVYYGPYQIRAQMNVMVLLSETQMPSSALLQLHHFSKHSPTQARQLYLNLAQYFIETEQYVAAFELLSRALTNLPHDSHLRYVRTLVALELGRFDILENDSLHLINIEPDNVRVLNTLGYYLTIKTNRFGEANKYLERALTLEPDNPSVLDSMGWLQYRQGNYAEALRYLRQAYTIDDNEEIAAHLGEVLWQSGQQQAAEEVWNHALEQHPANPILQETIERLKTN
ncbi:MAG: hypothetical protein CMF50_08430 [Legionellales bacterium]|nr:hypothetical protein [Legionellales bacterium]|tara:strand:+ start:8786 stop:10510 length:1725 start_codon:yes stop_codon:yes gene_type:complete